MKPLRSWLSVGVVAVQEAAPVAFSSGTSALFYSNSPGSGNHMRYNLTLPTDPSASNPNAVNKSYAFELSGAEWLGMAMCDTQSYPEQVSTCPPDSDKNILDPAVSPK